MQEKVPAPSSVAKDNRSLFIAHRKSKVMHLTRRVRGVAVMNLGLRDPNSFPPTALSLGLGPQTLAGPLYPASGWGKRE